MNKISKKTIEVKLTDAELHDVLGAIAEKRDRLKEAVTKKSPSVKHIPDHIIEGVINNLDSAHRKFSGCIQVVIHK